GLAYTTAHERASFASLLRQHRLAASLSQAALAERARMSVTAIAALERGRSASPRASTIVLLADALGLSIAERALLVASARVMADQPRQDNAQGAAPQPLTSFI